MAFIAATTAANLHFADNGKIVFHVAAVGVVYDQLTHTQQLYAEHNDDVLCLASQFDTANASAATVPHREATRLISNSQVGPGAAIERLPDALVRQSTVHSTKWVTVIQRHAGLYLTELAPALAAREAAGGHRTTQHERLGDDAINSANATHRHNQALERVARALGAAGARVTLCDRGDGRPASKEEAKRRYAHLNAGHVPDIAIGTTLYEIKAYTPYVAAAGRQLGTGYAGGGTPSTNDGHLIACGNTEEALVRTVLGLKQRGQPGEAFNRSTGAGYVRATDGDYADALQKKYGVELFVIESTGALAPRSVRLLKALSKAVQKPIHLLRSIAVAWNRHICR